MGSIVSLSSELSLVMAITSTQSLSRWVRTLSSQVAETLPRTRLHNHGIMFHRRKSRGREELSGDWFSPSTQAVFQYNPSCIPILFPFMVSKQLPTAPGTNRILVHIQQGERRGAVCLTALSQKPWASPLLSHWPEIAHTCPSQSPGSGMELAWPTETA